MNLLDETIDCLNRYRKSPNDVLWVGDDHGSYSMSWNEFRKIANIEYNSGFGSAEIPTDLVVVGDNWWLSRFEYDGSEYWQFNRKPLVSPTSKTFRLRLVTGNYHSRCFEFEDVALDSLVESAPVEPPY